MSEWKLSDGRLLSNYLAVGIAEGFEESACAEDVMLAWSYIGKNKLYLQLQGFFGRTLRSLYEQGFFDENFNIIMDIE